jgi:hypothetical protein
MPVKLSPEDLVTLKILDDKGQSHAQIARTLGVTEGAVRYQLRRQADRVPDRRRGKSRKADPLAQVLDHRARGDPPPSEAGPAGPINVPASHDFLVAEHQYRGSYRSALRLAHARHPEPRLRPFRRVETPPGARDRGDRGEVDGLDAGPGPETLNAFVTALSHSRKAVVLWCRRSDRLAWHHAHNEAFRRLGGIPAVLRIDDLNTGVVRGAGPWGRINAADRAYARSVGFHIDACPVAPRTRARSRTRWGRSGGDSVCKGRNPGLEAPQGHSDEQSARRDERRVRRG